MGMNVVALNPLDSDDETISRFDVPCRVWGILHGSMNMCCRDLLGNELLDLMGYNKGFGPGDAETCREIANRLDSMITDLNLEEVFAQYDWTEASWSLDCQGSETVVKFVGVRGPSGPVPEVVLREDVELFLASNLHLLRAWQHFLRGCGGFAVW